MPLSASVMVNKEEFGELLQDAIDGLPEELRQARWLLKERDDGPRAGRPRGGSDHRGGAACEPSAWSRRTEVVREARRTAESIIEHGDRQAAQIRHEAEDYVDRKLAAFEVVLDRTMQQVQKGRERLQVNVPTSRSSATPRTSPAASSTRTMPEPAL